MGDRIAEKEKFLKAQREQEFKLQNEFDTLRPAVEKLKGEKEFLEKESQKLREKFT